MSPTVLRWCAVPLGLLAFALRLVVTFWLEPLTWDQDQHLLMMLAGIVVTVAVPFGILVLLAGGSLRPPARLALGDGRFIAHASPIYACSQAIMWMSLGGGVFGAERVPNGDSMRMVEFGSPTPMTIIGVGFFWAIAAGFLLVRRPRLDLDPNGLTIHRVWRTTAIAWDELAPGGPVPPVRRRARQLRLYLNQTPVFGQYAASEDVPVGWLHADPAFLARALRHYVDNPQERALIGTEEGLRRLRAAAVPTGPSPLVPQTVD
ncbi:hypothetical protein [Catellatospora tritici]|uniref:hypothetical protein n=1 Tax=Catellatospora tritici TaxID=2851566 RepID=UPI001C2DB8B0|nr:hypothetical protein [Catellatospora tritici]MBV1856513.1 hypothetical protein [Catellatospora tritici]